MMKRALSQLSFSFAIYGYSTFCYSCISFTSASLLAFTDTQTGDGIIAFVKYLAILSAFLSPFLFSSALKPEDTPSLELHSTMACPNWQVTISRIIVHWLTLIFSSAVISWVSAFITENLSQGVLLALGVINVASNSLFFGGIAFWGTMIGRDSRKGRLWGLMAFLFSILIPFPNFLNPVIYPYRVIDGLDYPVLWGVSRSIYCLLGGLAFAHGLYLTNDTDRLLSGESSLAHQSANHKNVFFEKIIRAFSEPLPIPSNQSLGLICYEAWLILAEGTIPIMVTSISLLFTFLLPLLDALRLGFDTLPLSLIQSHTALVFFLFPFLPIFLVQRIPQDRKQLLDQSILANISPQRYLFGKVAGACVITGGIYLLSLLPSFFLLTITALFSSLTLFSHYFGILLLGVVPSLMYFCSLSILIGGMSGKQPPVFLGGLITIIFLVLTVITENNILGNILFPTGRMTIETFLNQMSLQMGLLYMPAASSPPVVPFYYLPLPVFSGALQTWAIWNIAMKVFEKDVFSA
ncbi:MULTISPECIES: hypothetical protein [Anaerolinea]|uniref:Hypothetical membrane protein n=1 Tax=Anaerolinea thermophila (strain DSM 14523 / JCM 11388 / NBRC 100420 / UNI-1) TaxID=926569 RepID=E8N1H8_ANATU|nr:MULTISPECIES: hypothetical protein [Anaerolinea]BAJ62583.1 hypothetical membrane protein [Anaerolinea thermophila UNI-1]